MEVPPQIRGNKVTADQLKDLVPGTSTRADATSVLGSPTAKGTFDDNTWIYISEVTQARVGRVQGINSQNVVQLTFDDRGILRGVKHLDQKDAQSVDVVSRATPSPGSEATFMQQLLGNVRPLHRRPERNRRQHRRRQRRELRPEPEVGRLPVLPPPGERMGLLQKASSPFAGHSYI